MQEGFVHISSRQAFRDGILTLVTLQFTLTARAVGGLAKEALAWCVHLDQAAPAIEKAVGAAVGILARIKLATIKDRLVRVAAAHALQLRLDQDCHRRVSTRRKNVCW